LAGILDPNNENQVTEGIDPSTSKPYIFYPDSGVKNIGGCELWRINNPNGIPYDEAIKLNDISVRGKTTGGKAVFYSIESAYIVYKDQLNEVYKETNDTRETFIKVAKMNGIEDPEGYADYMTEKLGSVFIEDAVGLSDLDATYRGTNKKENSGTLIITSDGTEIPPEDNKSEELSDPEKEESNLNVAADETKEDDPCVGKSAELAKALCEYLATTEAGHYGDTPSEGSKAYGRYQIESPAAIDALAYTRGMDKGAALKLFEKCRASTTDYCKKIQDEMCQGYIGAIIKQSKGFLTGNKKLWEFYLRWNMGASGGDTIQSEGEISTKLLGRMRNQAWCKRGTTCTGDSKQFINLMKKYMIEQGVQPDTIVNTTTIKEDLENTWKSKAQWTTTSGKKYRLPLPENKTIILNKGKLKNGKFF